jgi:hypothetical protein
VKPLLPVLVAGGTFAAAAIVGLFCGVIVAGRSGQALFAPAGLITGAAIGGYAALRLLMRSIS